MLGEITTEQLENHAIKKEKDRLIREIISDIVETKTELDAAVQNYNFADCEELLDHYTYKIKAAQTKYNMLLKKAKSQGLTNIEYLANNIKAVK